MMAGAQSSGVSTTPLIVASIKAPTKSSSQRFFWTISPPQVLQIVAGISGEAHLGQEKCNDQ
jgi:hypothetical protein